MGGFTFSLAKSVIKKYKPTVIGVVGDYEKEIVKQSIVNILETCGDGQVWGSPDLFQTSSSKDMILTVLGFSAQTKPWKCLFRAIKLRLFKCQYPKYLVLSYSVDAPGKLDVCMDLVLPDIGILSGITDHNIEYFGSLEKEIEEKGKLFDFLSDEQLLILNGDDPNILGINDKIKSSVLRYGFSDSADIFANNFTVFQDTSSGLETADKIKGIQADIYNDGKEFHLLIPGAMGVDYIRGAMVAILVAKHLNFNMDKVFSVFAEQYHVSAGRMSLVRGIKKTLIIDETAEASPYSVDIALQTLAYIPVENPGKKYAVLGDIMHLGRHTEEYHRQIGHQAAEAEIDYLYAVGERARDIIRGAKEAGMSEDRCVFMNNVGQTGKFIQNRLETGDLLLICGSAEMEMERMVKELMAKPLESRNVLVRQNNKRY